MVGRSSAMTYHNSLGMTGDHFVSGSNITIQSNMNCSRHDDLNRKTDHRTEPEQQANDDSTCDLSCSTLNTSMGELSVTDLGASLDLNRHSSAQRRQRGSYRRTASGRVQIGDDSDENLAESFDFLGESFAVDSVEDMHPMAHSRSQMGISLSRLGISMSNLATVPDAAEEDCSMSESVDLRRSNHSALAAQATAIAHD